MVGTIKKKVPEVAPEMDDRPASISATYQNREHDDPGLRLSYVWGKKIVETKRVKQILVNYPIFCWL
jgi:hypothetical protein